MSKVTKEQLIKDVEILTAMLGVANTELEKLRATDERHFEWQFARPTIKQPSSCLANVGYRLTKKGKLIGTGVVATLELVDGNPKLVPIKTKSGFSCFGFADPIASDKLAKHVMMLVDCDQLKDKYEAKVHGDKVVNQLELPGGKIVKGGRKVAEALG